MDTAPTHPLRLASNVQGALSGVRVLDFTRVLSGPFATMMLADQGATVIKVEPLAGDPIRAAQPFLAADEKRLLSGYFQSVNRNKRSLSIDLGAPDARPVLRRLCAAADVVVSNFRPGVMDALGLGYAAIREDNPRVVYASISGFGDDPDSPSPYRDWPAYDIVAQAMGGLIAVTGEGPGAPARAGPPVGDIFPGSLLAFGVLAALRQAERTGLGQVVEVAMYDAIVALCERAVYQHTYAGTVAEPEGLCHPYIPAFGIFRTRDGWAAIAAPGERFFGRLAEALDRPGWLSDPRFAAEVDRAAHISAVNAVVAARVAELSKAELSMRLGGRVPYGPVQTSAEIVADPHLAARRLLADVEQPGTTERGRIVGTPIKLYGTAGGVGRRAPLLGEDTREVLASLGYGDAELDELTRRHVIHGPPR